MSLKKNLKIGQASLEYFIVFAIVAVITILSFSSFLPEVRKAILGANNTTAGEGLFQKAAKNITQ